MNGGDLGSIMGGVSNVFTLFFLPWEYAVPRCYLLLYYIFWYSIAIVEYH